MFRIFLKGFLIFLIISFPYLTYARDICVYFTPSYAALDAIIEQINEAEKTIDVAVYNFTSRPLARALLRAKKRGVKIRVILDREANGESNRYSKYEFLKSNGISVRFAVPHIAWDREGLMHNKFAVIDKKTVITGSANWTASAFKINDENVIIIKREDIANVYEKEFEYLWKRSMLR
ncbi:phospholipase D family protein [Hippea alviniae]|uniref:phospholipase D family nuclease n=1 Tax=Hippea alviniae TaxID=1279027 RepID=UPI0003B3B6AE|nr:phospholipase D family protein [Hippea alviniae]